ncbi:MAG: right-handed parallel beta-helix repeat-containing protein [Bacteroidales bacterium]|nr:right-handed parallel beta-helix repeat-containing protein [Bacteroidales bacterium]
MKSKNIIILFVLVSFCLPWCIQGSLLNSTTWHIKQDGTGNFTTIQEGIIAASDADTVLVYPGIYYENIDYLEKSLTVASLYIITPEDSLIDQTIIDGNQEFRCVTIDECENVSLIGFTIQNGLAFEIGSLGYGGGIKIWEVSNLTISNCSIKNNKSIIGGGIFINQSNVVLSGNYILHNWGIEKAGGIMIGNNSNIQFSDLDLNNLYLNYSSSGSDIYISEYSGYITNVIVDTFTVSEPDYFFITPSEIYSFSCLNNKIEQIDQDLYISPDGNDNNSGLTLEDPLQTIAWAQTLIKRNDDNPNTIYLAPGVYSQTLNNQIFPLNIKHGVTYTGVSPYETILDAEMNSSVIHFSNNEEIYAALNINDIKMINGKHYNDLYGGAIYIRYQANLYLNNVVIENCFGETGSTIQSNDGYYNFNNTIVKNNSGGDTISLIANYQNQNPVLNVEIHNSLIQNNIPGVEEGSGGGISLHGHFNIPGDYNAKLINCEISGNHDNFFNSQTGLGGAAGLYIGDNLIADIVNCTFGENILSYSTGCVIGVNNSELNLYNSVLYNNDGYSFNLWENAVVNISHSLIEGGDDNVNYYYPLATVNWLDGNIDENPMFDSLGIYPFALSANSPCIDAGTLDLPPGIVLPEFDLAGNPRIYGETIDMGAYEWQGTGTTQNQVPITQNQLTNYPNPFNPSGAGRSPSTTIKLDLAESGKIELAIYNIKGQKIKTLMDAYSCKGHFEIIWRGTDENGKKVASGNYFIKLKVNGEEKSVRKCTLLK